MVPSHLILGCGYLGRVVGRMWRAGGHSVSALTRFNSQSLRVLGIDPLIGDVTDATTLRLPAADVVLYAIGLDRSAGKSRRDVYLGGLANVLNVLPNPRRFVFVSSTSVYGQADGRWVDESSPTEPTEENGRILVECEQLLRSRLPEAIILRFAGIYGPGRVLRSSALEKNEPFATDPDGWLNLIHVVDGAAAIEAAAERGLPGATYNVADGHPVTRHDFYTLRAQLLGMPPPTFARTPPATNRRVASRRIVNELAVRWRYPDYRSGLQQAIGGEA